MHLTGNKGLSAMLITQCLRLGGWEAGRISTKAFSSQLIVNKAGKLGSWEA